jgi:hypothetical protein
MANIITLDPLRAVKRILLSVAVAVSALSLAPPAHANDSDYYLTIINQTVQNLALQYASTSCATLSGDSATLPATLAPNTELRLHFYRSSDCHGRNGQVNLSAAESWPGPAPTSYPISISTDFTADGEFSLITQGTPVDAATRWAYIPYMTPDSSYGWLTFVNQDGVDLATALAGPCYAPDDNNNIMQFLPLYSDVGSVTLTQANAFRSAVYTSQLQVTTEVWGFRAPTFFAGESVAMQRGFLLSKAMRTLRTSDDAAARAAFWLKNGPRISEGPDAAAQLLGLRLLATAKSDTPRSQTVSVALNYETASTFRQPWDDYVYAFRFVPGSEVFGRTTCTAINPAGELQFQPVGGTTVYDLMRSADGVTWTAWNGSDWVASSVIPSNQLTPLLAETAR